MIRRKHRITFDDALDAALEALARGESMDDVLAAHPAEARRMQLLLDTAITVRGIGAPAPKHLAANFQFVREALRDERTIKAIRPRRREDHRPRRLTFAHLSLPASAYALIMVAGISGVAGASVAIGPNFVTDLVIGNADAPDSLTHQPATSGEQTAVQPATDATTESSSPQADQQPKLTLTGQVFSVSGGSFSFAAGGVAWSVVFDSSTEVHGDLASGATLTLAGYVTGDTQIYATSIIITSGDEAAAVETAISSRTSSAVSGSEPDGVYTVAGDAAAPQPAGEQPAGEQPAATESAPDETTDPAPSATPEPGNGKRGNGHGPPSD